MRWWDVNTKIALPDIRQSDWQTCSRHFLSLAMLEKGRGHVESPVWQDLADRQTIASGDQPSNQ